MHQKPHAVVPERAIETMASGPSDPDRSIRGRAMRAGGALRRHVWLLPIVLLALWLRLANLRSETLFGDEAEYAIVARYLSHDLRELMYPALSSAPYKTFVSQPPLVLYAMALSIRVFGPTDFAAILPSVLFGTMTVVVCYAAACRLGGRVPAVVAALIVAALPFHVDMSRKAMLDAGYVFFVMLTCYGLIAWAQTREHRDALLTGVAMAAACMSKLPGVLVVPVVAAGVGVVLGLDVYAKRDAWGRRLRELVPEARLFVIPLLIAALFYLFLLDANEALDAFIEKLSWNVERVQMGDASAESGIAYYLHNPTGSFHALIGRAVVALGVAGFVTALGGFAFRSHRRVERLVAPFATLVFLAFFLSSQRKVGFYLLPFVPFGAMLVAGLVSDLRDLIRWGGIRFTPKLASRLTPIAAGLALSIVALPAYAAISTSTQEVHADEGVFGYGTREAAEWIGARDPGAAQYGTMLGRFTLRWYNDQTTYHFYNDHARIHDAIKADDLRFIVYDEYLGKGQDTAFMMSLVDAHGGKAVATFEKDWGRVVVYRVYAG